MTSCALGAAAGLLLLRAVIDLIEGHAFMGIWTLLVCLFVIVASVLHAVNT